MTEETPERSAEIADSAELSGIRLARLVQLEEGLKLEKEVSARLRSEVRDLIFKLDILERAYSKQLEDERARCDAAEKRVAEHSVRIVELDSAREDAIGLLTEAKTEIDRLTAECDQLCRQLGMASGSGAAGTRDAYGDDGTINTLLDDFGWPQDEDSGSEPAPKVGQQTETPDDEPVEDMISPDIVFASGDSED